MPARAHALFDAIASFPALRAAALRAATGKRRKPGVAAFLANLETEVLRLERALLTGRYRPGRYQTLEVFDPKHRIVSAAPFRDRVVHHALCAVIEPVFERGFIFDSYANRRGKGTHRAVARYERFRDRSRHVLRCDIYRYFPAIDHEILKRDLRRRIACPPHPGARRAHRRRRQPPGAGAPLLPRHDQPHGHGVLIFHDGKRYEGEFRDGGRVL